MILPAIAFLSLSAAAPSPLIDDGRARLANGDARGAMIQAERAVREDPANAEARVLLARALLVLGEADRAEKMARAGLRDGGGDPARLVLAEALYTLGRFDDALAAAAEADASSVRAALNALAQAELALNAGDPEAALGGLRAAIAEPGFERRAELTAARAQYARGDLVRAQRLLDGLLEADDRSFQALLLRARVALRSGDASRAGQLAAAMLARDPGNVSAGTVAIEAAIRQDDLEEARRLLGTLSASPEDPRPAYLNGLVLLSEGRVREAGNAVAGIEGWLKSIDGGAVLLAQIRADAGRLAQAEKILRDRLRAQPGDVAAAAMLVDTLLEAGKADRADEVLEDALRTTPEAPLLRGLRAERLIADGKLDEGLAVLADQDGARADLFASLFGAGEGEGPSSEIALSYAALRRGDADGARMAAMRAVAEDRSAAALNLLAAAEARSGNEKAAEALLREAVEMNPDFLAPIANLAALSSEPNALLAELERAKAAGAASAPVLMQLATELFAAGRDADAAEIAAEAAKTGDPDAALLSAKVTMARGGDPSDALISLISLQSDDPATVLQAAAMLEVLGRAGEAAPALSALARRTGDARHDLAAAAAASAAGDDRAAVLSARRARTAAPEDIRTAEAVIRYETNLVGLGGGQARAARLAEMQEGMSAAYASAVALDAAGDVQAAMETLLAEDEPSRRSLLLLLSLSEGTDARPAALERLSAFAEDNPGDVGILVALSAGLIDAGRSSAAEDVLRRALAARPGDPVVLNNLASLRANRDPAGALRLAETAYVRAPADPDVADTYARLLDASGQRAEGLSVLRKARLAAPRDERLAEAVRAMQ